MSFSQQRAQISAELTNIESVQDYKRVYLTSAVVRSIEHLNKKFVEHLFADLVEREIDINIRRFLKERDKYQVANDYARECIEPSFFVKNIYGPRIKAWTNAALKCFDVFLIKLIEDYLKEKIRKQGSQLKERDVYTHLIIKGDKYLEIGTAFQTIYQKRNDFTHVQYETRDGQRHYKKWSRSKYDYARDLIIAEFEKALNILIKEIKYWDSTN